MYKTKISISIKQIYMFIKTIAPAVFIFFYFLNYYET